MLRLDRALPEIQERYQKCLRRYWQVQRCSDLSYRKEVLSLDYAQTLRLYTMIRDTLLDNALDKHKADPALLFLKGLEELDNALSEPSFIQRFLPAAKPGEIRVFRDFLKRTWAAEQKLTKSQAFDKLRGVVLAAQNMINLSSSATIME